jgi:hypothetical protein
MAREAGDRPAGQGTGWLRPVSGQCDSQTVETSPSLRFARLALRMTIAGAVMLVGAIVAYSVHAPAIIKAAFLVLMIACGLVGLIFARIFLSKVKAERDQRRMAAPPADL